MSWRKKDIRNYDLFYIYVVQNMINGKTYIGQRKCPRSTTPEKDCYKGSGIYLEKAKKKYGIKNFKKEVLEVCWTQEEADFLEKRYIRFYRLGGMAEYNIADGGHSGNLGEAVNETRSSIMQSKEYRKKMSEKLKGVNSGDNNPAKRPEVRKKISESCKGRKSWNKGKKMSVKARDNMARAQQKREQSTRHPFNIKKGFHWFTNGSINKRGYVCPDGFWKGRTK